MVEISKEMSGEEKLSVRGSRIKRRLIYINIASVLCLLFVPFWAGIRMFFCWEDSCSGIICWFCELHWVISILLLVFLMGFVLMSLELFRASADRPSEPLPETIDDPWIPGVKTAVKTAQVLANSSHKIAEKMGKVPGTAAVSKVAHGVGAGVKAIPGVKSVQKGTAAVVEKTGYTVRRMEHGRALLHGKGPARWTFILTVVAFLAALFLMIGPFKYVFWP